MKLVPYLKSLSEVVNIPVCVYSKNEFLFLPEEHDSLMLPITKVYSYIIKQSESFIWMDGLLMFYKLEYNENTVILGPAISYLPTDHSITSTLLSADIFLTKDEAILLSDSLSRQGITKYEAFTNCINMMSLAILDKSYTSRGLQTPYQEIADPESTVIENIETEWSNQNIEYVEMLTYFIENGMEDEIRYLFKTENPAPYGKLAHNDLRHYKNSMMVHIYIVRCAAHKGGLDEDLCIRLAQSYAQQCEAAQSVEELGAISHALRLDFCRRTKKVRVLSTNNLTITKAIHYIREHRINKINASTIANALGISSSYLCSEFKKETGVSIVEYVQKEKIELAKKLLLYSEYSLSDISAYLSFSSQSYFQTVFKKLEGKTPSEFRRSKNPARMPE